MVISLLNQKGGVGKTTLAVHLAMALAQRGERVLLLDAAVQGSALDWAARDIVDLISEASAFKENLQSVFVINRKIVNTAIGRDVVEALGAYAIPVLNSQICQRVAFAESAAAGSTVLEDAPTSAAALEINALATELSERYAPVNQ